MSTSGRWALVAILLACAALGLLYAAYTPAWQVPDEPAHYNYIRGLVERGALPVMEPGDYDQAYLERLTAGRFPPDLSIAPLTYEDHQPPLYYLLAAPLYRLFDGALLPLRLFSVGLGLLLLVVTCRLVRTLFPDRPFLALATVALIAFLPQHLAMTAGVENDGLAELLLAAVLWVTVRMTTDESRGLARRDSLILGLLLGCSLLTKTTAYVGLPVALAGLALRGWRERRGGGSARPAVVGAGLALLVALLLAGPWLARNVAIYGWQDPLGLARHAQVVIGQPRTADWLARYGWVGLTGRFLRTTFNSFWGQFGWMGVPLHEPFYAALGLFSALLAAGFLGWRFDRRRPRLSPAQADGLRLLALSALLTTATYVWYNLTFVQHQGRYLFPALVPLALGAALGLDWLLSPPVARWAAGGLMGAAALLVVWGLARGDLPLLPLLTAGGLAALCGLAAWRPGAGRWLALALLACALVALDLYALFGAIVPTLAG